MIYILIGIVLVPAVVSAIIIIKKINRSQKEILSFFAFHKSNEYSEKKNLLFNKINRYSYLKHDYFHMNCVLFLSLSQVEMTTFEEYFNKLHRKNFSRVLTLYYLHLVYKLIEDDELKKYDDLYSEIQDTFWKRVEKCKDIHLALQDCIINIKNPKMISKDYIMIVEKYNKQVENPFIVFLTTIVLYTFYDYKNDSNLAKHYKRELEYSKNMKLSVYVLNMYGIT